MKNTLRNEVLEFLKNLPKAKYEQFNKAFELFRKCEPKNHNAERNYNMGFTENNLKNILYDLQKHYNISNIEILAKPIPSEPAQIEVAEIQEYILKMDETQLREWAQTECTIKGTGLAELIKTAEKEKNEFIVKILTEELKKINDPLLDADANKGADNTKMRDEFAFLNEKDCPSELKILVADKMTAYKNYTEAQAKLTAHANKEIELTEDEVSELTKSSVENFEENQNIYNELNHYKETKEILGVHPIFNKLKMEREVAAMDNKELHNYIGSSAKFFTVKKQELSKEKDADKIAKLNLAVDLRNQKLAMVKKKLNIA